MNFVEAAIFLLFLASVSVPIANRFQIPHEIFLVIGSCIISLIPGSPFIQLQPTVVFQLFLPPILFYSAYFASWQDLKFNRRPILLLAFGLTIFTSFVVAGAAVLFIPGFTWLEGLLLGSIVSPTDASSAISIIKRIGAPRRLLTLLAGESLINDAAALILFRFTLSALIVGTFSVSGAIIQFFIMSIGGVALGLALGYIAVKLLQWIKAMQAEVTISFITAFSCFLIAERLGLSGVIATVVCGLYFGLQIPSVGSSTTRVNAKSNWNTLIFIINGFIFTIIGLELPFILQHIKEYSVPTLIFYGAIISLVIIVTRIVWMFPAAYLPRLFFRKIVQRDPMPPWQFLVVLGWAGMRGIISLAAALSIPITLTSTGESLHRDLILFLTYCVIVATLLLPTFTLPLLLRSFKLKDDSDELLKEEVMTRINLIEKVMAHITKVAEKENIPCEIFNDFYKQIERRRRTIESQLTETPYSTLSKEYYVIKRLALLATRKERNILLELRKMGKIHDDTFHLLLDEVDLEEVRIRSVRF